MILSTSHHITSYYWIFAQSAAQGQRWVRTVEPLANVSPRQPQVTGCAISERHSEDYIYIVYAGNVYNIHIYIYTHGIPPLYHIISYYIILYILYIIYITLYHPFPSIPMLSPSLVCPLMHFNAFRILSLRICSNNLATRQGTVSTKYCVGSIETHLGEASSPGLQTVSTYCTNIKT